MRPRMQSSALQHAGVAFVLALQEQQRLALCYTKGSYSWKSAEFRVFRKGKGIWVSYVLHTKEA